MISETGSKVDSFRKKLSRVRHIQISEFREIRPGIEEGQRRRQN